MHKPPRSGGGGRCGWQGRRVIMKECPLLPRWKRTESILSFLRSRPRTAFWTLLLTLRAIPFLLKDSCSRQNIKWPSELNSPIPIHFSSLSLKMSMFTLAISCLTMSNLDSWAEQPGFLCSVALYSIKLSPPDTSFFLEPSLHSSPVAYQISTLDTTWWPQGMVR